MYIKNAEVLQMVMLFCTGDSGDIDDFIYGTGDTVPSER